jgi:hypothetical protein
MHPALTSASYFMFSFPLRPLLRVWVQNDRFRMSKDSSSKKQNETLDQRMNLPMLMALHGFTGRGFPKEVTAAGQGSPGNRRL